MHDPISEALTEYRNQRIQELLDTQKSIDTLIHFTRENIENFDEKLDDNDDQIPRLAKDFLTNQEIELLKNFFKKISKGKKRKLTKLKHIRNIEYKQREKCLEILQRYPFFNKFPPDAVEKILFNSTLKKFESGEYIFHQGDDPDGVYVILYGYCNAVAKQKMFSTDKNSNEYRIISNLPHGGSFGEFSLLATAKKPGSIKHIYDQIKGAKVALGNYGSKILKTIEKEKNLRKLRKYRKILDTADRFFKIGYNKKFETEEEYGSEPESDGLLSKYKKNGKIDAKRAAGVRAVQETYVLQIPPSLYTDTLLPLTINDLYRKIELLKRLSFSHSLKPISLLIVANTMKKRVYRLGEPLLEEGEIPDKFIIISEGSCKMLWRKVVERRIKFKEKVILRDRPLRNLKFSDFRKDKPYKNEKEEEMKVHIEGKFKFENEAKKPKNPKDNFAFTVHEVVKILKSGDFINLRAFLKLNVGLKNPKYPDKVFREHFKTFKNIKKAKFHVVADCARLIVYELPSSYFRLLPGYVLVKKYFLFIFFSIFC